MPVCGLAPQVQGLGEMIAPNRVMNKSRFQGVKTAHKVLPREGLTLPSWIPHPVTVLLALSDQCLLESISVPN